MVLKALVASLSLCLAARAETILFNAVGFGMTANDEDSYDVEFTNAQAFTDAINAASDWKADHENDEVIVHVPSGNWYSMMPVRVENISGITIRIDGTLKASKRHTRYPITYQYKEDKYSWKETDYSIFYFGDSSDLKFEGSGTVDGQGFMWWLREYIVNNPASRPHLFEMRRCRNVEITGIRWINSPRYHMYHRDIDNFYYHDFEIYVDYWGQFILGQFFLGRDTMWEIDSFSLPTFPLNTDGIDPAGSNILIERVNITNFDDAVAVKPSDQGGEIATCSENIIVRDAIVTFGVGMTLGSVPPHDAYNCIRNVTFQRIVFFHPFKAVYVKTNPGTTTTMLPGSGGEITNILYEDLTIHHPIWWSVYIGPQQQKQPDGGGPGCMFYPFGGCET